MGIMGLLGIEIPFVSATTSAGANPQLQFFENFPGKDGAGFIGVSENTFSFHAVNIPLSLSFGYPIVLYTAARTTTHNATFQFGLYSLNVSTLSLANSASATTSFNAQTFTSWVSMVTSATQNISPGAWYFAFNVTRSGGNPGGWFGNSSINLGNASPVFVRGRMTASTNAMPASIATSALDITGSDAMRQPFIIITA